MDFTGLSLLKIMMKAFPEDDSRVAEAIALFIFANEVPEKVSEVCLDLMEKEKIRRKNKAFMDRYHELYAFFISFLEGS